MANKTLAKYYVEHAGKLSDKWSGYLVEYERIFDKYRNYPVRLLEIGIQNGGSLEIWLEYFSNAKKIVGCDVDPECARLCYEDSRIAVVVGDANSDSVQAKILDNVSMFDIIIDDGSHRSGDIIKSFARYFPYLSDRGVYVIEDLHCSYWMEFGGGLFEPFSSMTFFKRIADIVNHEHWGIPKKNTDILNGFIEKYDLKVEEQELRHVHSVEFVNSICVIRKAIPERNTLGKRIIVGSTAPVMQRGDLSASPDKFPNQSANEWANRSKPPEEELLLRIKQLADRDRQLADRDRQLADRDRQLADRDRQLVDRDRQLVDCHLHISNLNQSIAIRDNHIADFQLAVSTHEKRINDLNDAVVVRDMHVANLDKVIQQQQSAISEIHSSFSWQLVRLFRRMRDAVAPFGSRRKRLLDLPLRFVKSAAHDGIRVAILNSLDKIPTPRFFDLLMFRRYTLKSRPIHDVIQSNQCPESWVSTGNDPQFILKGRFPKGWVNVSFWKKNEILDSMRLYMDLGDGFNEDAAITIGTITSSYVYLDPRIRQIRMDPFEGKSDNEFSIGRICLRSASRIEIILITFLRRYGYYKKTLGFWKTTGLFLKILFSSDFKSIKEKIKEHTVHPSVEGQEMYKRWIAKNEYRSADEPESIQNLLVSFRYHPVFSIIVPTYNTPEEWLISFIESVRNQIYPHFELCVADDASTQPHVRNVLERYKSLDKRIKVLFREMNGHISAATNSALELAIGDYVCLMDHDDEISPNALYEFAKLLNKNPDIDMIYSDEDKIDMSGRRYEPFFKPDWSPEYLESCMYTAHFACYRTSIVRRIGGFRKGYDGAQDYDFVLRFIDHARVIRHIPKIFYHWRAIPGSTALSMKEKKYVLKAAVLGLEDHMKRRGAKGTVEINKYHGCFNVVDDIVGRPRVSIIIPSAGRTASIRGKEMDLLSGCISSIVEKSTYDCYEIIVVDNDDLSPKTSANVRKNVTKFVHYRQQAFNVAAKMNMGARESSGDYLLFLNDDTEVITTDWLEKMLSLAQRDAIGSVGPKLLFEDGTLQHAGVSFIDGLPDHVFRGYPGDFPGYFFNVCGNRNYLAVTGACLMTKRHLFEKVGGFNECFAINYNDIDYCMKVHHAGFRNVYTPHAILYHYESLCRKREVSQAEQDLFLQLWGDITKNDPYYSPHLDCRPPNFFVKYG